MSSCSGECKTKEHMWKKFLLRLKGYRIPKYQLDDVKGQQEFTGPVKVVLVTTPKRAYQRKSWGAAGVVLAYFAVGAVAIPILFFALSFYLEITSSLHVMLFTLGFQLLTPAAFLTMDSSNGSADVVKKGHRKFDYLILKLSALLCIVGGLVASSLSPILKFKNCVWTINGFDPHAAIGTIAVVMTILDTFTCFLHVSCENSFFPCRGFRSWKSIGKTFTQLAVVLCIPAFLMAQISFILSLYKANFVKWLPILDMRLFFIIFLVYYTIICTYNPINDLRCQRKMKPVPFSEQIR